MIVVGGGGGKPGRVAIKMFFTNTQNKCEMLAFSFSAQGGSKLVVLCKYSALLFGEISRNRIF